MSTRQRIETKRLEDRQPLSGGRRNLDRRSFLRAAAAFGATVGIAAAHSIPTGGVALASETTGKKDVSSRSLRAARCPVTGDSVSKEASIDYRGGKLYFCSAECIDKFRADRPQYEAKANAQLVVTEQYKQTRCPLTGDELAPRFKTRVCGVNVCFSSAECLKKVKRASADEREELVFGEGFDKGFGMEQETQAAQPSANKWQCVVCGYVHTGSTPPAKCPKCNAKSDSFVPMG